METPEYNIFNLQTRTNFFRRAEDFQGNGLNGTYCEGKFENGSRFYAYPFSGNFYLYVNDLMVDKRRVIAEDQLWYMYRSDVFYKYVDAMLTDYAAANNTAVVVPPPAPEPEIYLNL